MKGLQTLGFLIWEQLSWFFIWVKFFEDFLSRGFEFHTHLFQRARGKAVLVAHQAQ